MILVVISLTLILISGCGKMVPLKGTVVFSDDGSPITQGAICFTDGKNMARGTINEDGSFEVGFVGMKDGMPPGTYTIYFFGVGSADSGETRTIIDAMGNRVEVSVMGQRVPLIDPKYERPETSGLQAEITKNIKTMDIKVDRFVSGSLQRR